ncbi:MAG: 4Fe-4S binding protein [candidate division Zixibacteria bacterium]|nr:4Fe-4S binding protein [candidate division Zixibacteria bacterium]
MAIRQIIRIDEEKCNGCGDCVPACHEGALAIINGKAKLVNEVYCDGLGACLGKCPKGAIMIEERDTVEYDAEATARHIAMLKIRQTMTAPAHGGGCPGSANRTLTPASTPRPNTTHAPLGVSELRTWPVQLKLVAPNAPFLFDADLLLCADCVPFAVPDFHSRFLAGKVLLVGCPKLDDLNFYHQKLMTIFAEAKPRSITVLKMEVPCCTGIAQAALHARESVAPELPASVFTIGINGDIRQERISGSNAGIPVV